MYIECMECLCNEKKLFLKSSNCSYNILKSYNCSYNILKKTLVIKGPIPETVHSLHPGVHNDDE